MLVRRASDARPSSFIGTRGKPLEYAVTNDPAHHAPLPGSKVVENREDWNILVFSGDWLNSFPSKSACSSQSPGFHSSFGGSTSHEHDTGGREHEQ